MKPFLVVFCIAGVSLLSSLLRAQACPVAVMASVDLAEGPLSLADLLAPNTCPELRRAAAGVRLGSVPLAGSARVMLGSDVAILLAKLSIAAGERPGNWRVPQRVTVHRAGPRASCAEIMARILSAPVIHSSLPETDLGAAAPSEPGRDGACGAGGRIALSAPLEFTRTAWNAALATWDVSARCLHAADCVPFLVRVPERNSRLAKRPSGHSMVAKITLPKKPLVRPGEAVTLLWDQDGIRLVVPAVCLDQGMAGEAVRARIVRGGRMVRAVVESAGRLRVAS